MVEADNTKSKREFKRMTKSMGEKLDKEKGRSVRFFIESPISCSFPHQRSIEELQAPDFKGSDETSKVKQRADERERSRDAPHDAHSMRGMQYTFPVAPPPAVHTVRPKPTPAAPSIAPVEEVQELEEEDHVMAHEPHQRPPHDIKLPASPIEAKQELPSSSDPVSSHRSGFTQVVRFPALFASDFSPTALLGFNDSSRPRFNYGEDTISVHMNIDSSDESMSVSRPAFEFPLDELMDSPDAQGGAMVELDDAAGSTPLPPSPQPAVAENAEHTANSSSAAAASTASAAASAAAAAEFQAFKSPSSTHTETMVVASPVKPNLPCLSTSTFSFGESFMSTYRSGHPATLSPSSDLILSPLTSTIAPTPTPPLITRGRPRSSSKHQRDEDSFTPPSVPRSSRHAHSASVPGLSSSSSSTLYDGSSLTSVSTVPSRRNSLKGGRHAAPSATPPPRAARPNHGNTAPGGVKSECANCGATSTPLWRRGLNDELNCNVSSDAEGAAGQSSRRAFFN